MRSNAIPRARAAALALALTAVLTPAFAHAWPLRAASLPAPSLLATGTAPVERRSINGVPDTGQFLPDSATLARVDEKSFSVQEFIWNYFNSFPTDRPKPDSLGRVSFSRLL